MSRTLVHPVTAPLQVWFSLMHVALAVACVLEARFSKSPWSVVGSCWLSGNESIEKAFPAGWS